MTGRLRIEKLHRAHPVEDFSCGSPELDRFLVRHALQAQQAGSSLTYVGLSESSVIGFYSLVVGEARRAEAPERVAKGMPRHPIPLMVLARLAVRSDWQGRGVGAGLLRDALERTMNAADIAGIRARSRSTPRMRPRRLSISISASSLRRRTRGIASC